MAHNSNSCGPLYTDTDQKVSKQALSLIQNLYTEQQLTGRQKFDWKYFGFIDVLSTVYRGHEIMLMDYLKTISKTMDRKLHPCMFQW